MTTLDKIKTLLGMEVSLKEMKLNDGSIVIAEIFEAGASISKVVDGEESSLEVGEYELEDGQKFTVEEAGIIASIENGPEEVSSEDAEETEEVEAEVEVEVETEVEEEAPEVSLESRVTALESRMEAWMEANSTEQVELSTEVETEVEVSETVTHSPEANVSKKINHLQFNKNIRGTMKDRVFASMFNNKN